MSTSKRMPPSDESPEQRQAGFKFEDAMKRLEDCVRRLEQGNLPLEESLEQYSIAVKLLATCQIQLEQAERRIELLTGVDAQGNPIKRSLEDHGDLSLEEKQAARSQRRSAKRSTKPHHSASDDDEPDQDQRLF